MRPAHVFIRFLAALFVWALFVWALFVWSGSICSGSAFADELSRIAVKPADSAPNVASAVKRTNIASELQAELEAALVAGGKFTVVTRTVERLKEIRDEQEFAASELSAGNAAAAGGLEAADYYLKPTITGFSFGSSHVAIPNIDDKYRRTDAGSLSVDIQVFDTTKGTVVKTFTLRSGFSSSPGLVNSRSGGPDRGRLTTMAREASAQLSDQLINAVFPMKVAWVSESGKEIRINRGQGTGLKPGATLAVYRQSEEIFDPDTKQSLGRVEDKQVASVKVTKVESKLSAAEVLPKTGVDAIQVGDVLRAK